MLPAPSLLHNTGMLTSTKSLTILLLAASSLAFGQQPKSLNPPATGKIPVAFVLTSGAVMIDFAGPWEVFQDVMIPSRGPRMEDQHVFQLYTVSDTKDAIRTSGGMQITPDYTFDDAPRPKIVVIPAQMGHSPKMLEWLRTASKNSDVVMSVCTGAFKLAAAGLLDDKPATTHHGSYAVLQQMYPKVKVQRDRRYVQSDPVIFTSGGLSAGIDLALHIVDAYFGHEIAASTAQYMEYEGLGWQNPQARVKYSEVGSH
jgi:transcriptional regulator GlxA family with amidase domain